MIRDESKLWMFMTREEEEAYYYETLDRIIANPRLYLDNLEYLKTFRVSFIQYNPRKRTSKGKIYK